MSSELIKISAIGPFGVNSGGVWYKLGKGVKPEDFIKGCTYSIDVATSTKGAKYINKIVSNMGAQVFTKPVRIEPLLNPDLNTEKATPNVPPPDTRPLNEYGKPVSDYAIAKDKRIARSGVIQAAVQAMSAHVSNREQLEKESILLAEAMLTWVQQ